MICKLALMALLALPYGDVFAMQGTTTTTTTTTVPQQNIKTVVFAKNNQPVASISAQVAKLLSPVIRANIEHAVEMKGNVVGDSLYINLDKIADVSSESIKTFVNLLEQKKLQVMPGFAHVGVIAAQQVSAYSAKKLSEYIAGVFEKEVELLLKEPSTFFELLFLIDYFQVESLAESIARELPGIIAHHIDDPLLSNIDLSAMPAIIKKAFFVAVDKTNPSNKAKRSDSVLTVGESILFMEMSSNGSYIALGLSNRHVIVYDVKAKNFIATSITDLNKQSWSNPVKRLSFSNNGDFLAVACEKGLVKLFNTVTKEVTMLEAPNKQYGFHAVAVSPDGNYVVATNNYDFIGFFDSKTGQNLTFPTNHFSEGPIAIRDIAFSNDGNYLATASARGGIIEVIDITKALVSNRFITGDLIKTVMFSPDSKVLAGIETWGLSLYDLKNNTKLISDAHDNESIKGCCFSFDNKYVATLTSNEVIRIIDRDTLKVRDFSRELKLPLKSELDLDRYGVLAFSHDSAMLAYSLDHKVIGIDLVSNLSSVLATHPLKIVGLERNVKVTGLEFSVDDKFLITAATDKTLKMTVLNFGKLSFVQALAMAIFEKLKASKTLAKIPTDSFLLDIVNTMPEPAQAHVKNHYSVSQEKLKEEAKPKASIFNSIINWWRSQ